MIYEFRDSTTGKSLFIGENPTLSSIVKEYERQFPLECKIMLSDLEEDRKSFFNEKGMSQGKTVRTALKIPTLIYYAVKHLIDEDFWLKDNQQNYRDFLSECPKLGVGSI